MKPTTFDFESFQRNTKPNSYLVCPKDLCHTKIDAPSPVFNVGLTTLQIAWQKLITDQPRIQLLADNTKDFSYQYVQRSLIFRFPDIINVKLIPLDHTHSTIALYSSSVYGHYDFNVNQKRVRKWLSALQHEVSKQHKNN